MSLFGGKGRKDEEAPGHRPGQPEPSGPSRREPEPGMRGKRNDPRNVVHVIRYAAGLLNMDADQLSAQACRNCRALFGEPA